MFNKRGEIRNTPLLYVNVLLFWTRLFFGLMDKEGMFDL